MKKNFILALVLLSMMDFQAFAAFPRITHTPNPDNLSQLIGSPYLKVGRLSARDLTTGGTAELFSSIGFGGEIGLLQPLSEKFSLGTSLGWFSLPFVSTPGTTLTQPGGFIEFNVSPIYELSSLLRIYSNLSLSQTPFFATSLSSTLNIDNPWIIKAAIASNFGPFLHLLTFGFNIETGFALLYSAGASGYSIEPGYHAHVKGSLGRSFGFLFISSGIRMEYSHQNTSLAKHYMILAGLDVSLTWNFGLAKGMEPEEIQLEGTEDEKFQQIQREKEKIAAKKKLLEENRRKIEKEQQRLKKELENLQKKEATEQTIKKSKTNEKSMEELKQEAEKLKHEKKKLQEKKNSKTTKAMKTSKTKNTKKTKPKKKNRGF